MRLKCLDGTPSDLLCRPFSAGSGKQSAFSRKTPTAETTVGFDLWEAPRERVLTYAPAVQDSSSSLWGRLQGRAAVLFDGTCWRDDELISLGLRGKRARSMGHVPIDGPDGTLHQLALAQIDRKVYTHINNSNPILLEDSPERAMVEAEGIEIGYDGMELEL